LASPVNLYPQYTKNVKVKDKNAVFKDDLVIKEKQNIEQLINGEGRILLRKSGTEPVVRVMVESKDNAQEYAERLAKYIIERGHSVE